MPFAGFSGSVTATGMQTDVTAWAIDENCLMIDVSVLGTQERAFIPGPLEWNGTMAMLFSASNTVSAGGSINGTWTMTSGQTKAGKAYISQIGTAVEYEGAVLAPVTFQGTGALT